MKASECNEQIIEIPINEYKHLKECKDRLIDVHKRQISELRDEMITSGISAIINNTIVNNTSFTNNVLINPISAYLI